MMISSLYTLINTHYKRDFLLFLNVCAKLMTFPLTFHFEQLPVLQTN